MGNIPSIFSNTKESYFTCLGVNLAAYFLHALPYRSEKYYDLIGSLSFSLATIASYLRNQRSYSQINPSMLASICLLLWCNRLGWFLINRILASGGDRRFDKIKQSPLHFLFAWVMQAHWNYLVGLPVYLLNASPQPSSSSQTPVLAPPTASPPKFSLTSGQLLSLLVWAAGFILEVVADHQKHRFKLDPRNADRFITGGLWSVCRHPNYLGEITLWIGLASFAFTSLRRIRPDFSPAVVFVSPLFTFCLLRFLSGVPMLENNGIRKWGHLPEYQNYLQQTPRLLPTWDSITRMN